MFKPSLLRINNSIIAIISISEKQFGASQFNREGVNFFTPFLYSTISEIKNKCDFLIISIHNGQELSLWPSPVQQQLMKSFIDAGADIVHGHHSHIPQGYERYKHGFISYGLGNFIVDPEKWKSRDNTLWSNAIEVELTKNSEKKFSISHCQLIDSEDSLRVVGLKSCIISEYLQDCSEALSKPLLLSAIWQEYSVTIYRKVYSKWLESAYKPSLNKIILNKKREIQNQLLIYHLISCSSHSHAIETALGVLCGELEDLRNSISKELVSKYVNF